MAGSIQGGVRRGTRWSLLVWGGAACLLALPLIAMQFDTGVVWTGIDFATAGAMLLTACGAFELAVRMTGNLFSRAGAGVAILGALMLVWVNLAVGFLGDEGNPANLLFLGVIAIIAVGAGIMRFRPAGMVKVMLAAAAAQVLVGAGALAAGWTSPGSEGLYEVTMGTSLFTVMWLLSAGLFHKGATDQAAT